MTTSKKWAENLADWALEGRRWRGAIFFAAIGGFTLAVISPGLLSFYLLYAAQENAEDLSSFLADWRIWGAIASALVMHFIYARLL